MTLPSSFQLLGASWNFYRKQPVLGSVLFWLIFLPTLGNAMLSVLFQEWITGHDQTDAPPIVVLILLGILLCALLALWGTCCVLVIGKRIMQANAGRSRTSFSAVRSSAKKLIVPLLLTGILRSVFTLFWALLLIVPGIIYAIRTTLFSVIIACEGLEYRDALRRSSEIVKPVIFQVFIRLIAISIILFVPISLLQIISVELVQPTDLLGSLLVAIPVSGLSAFSSVLLLLSLIFLYKSIVKPSRKFEQYNPPIDVG